MDNGAIIGLVALATAVFTGLGLFLKHSKHSECMRGCCEIDTRSPTRMDSVISQPPAPPSPQTHHARQRKYAESDSEFDLQIAEIEV